ncbi:glycosyltransferase [Nocardiopsis algeriensis]|uniref:glycosyltransferase n=1 Tax=Nocardiopsis algeriensis TaxID=1478215 RepID=UPI003B42F9B9
MILSALRQALRTCGREPALLCRAGGAGALWGEVAGVRLRPCDRVVDLDVHPVGERVEVEGVGGEGEPGSVGLVAVVAASVSDLRRAVAVAGELPRAAHLLVAVEYVPAHLGPLAPVPPGMDEWNDLYELRVRRVGRRGWICEAFFPGGGPVAEMLSCLVHGARGRRRGPGTGFFGGLHGRGAGAWLPGELSARGAPASGPVEMDRVTPVSDVVLRLDEGQGLPFWEDVEVPALDRYTAEAAFLPPGDLRAAALHVHGPDPVGRIAPVDERLVNPSGFRTRVKGPVGVLAEEEGRVLLSDDRKVRVEVPRDGTVTENDLARLRDLRGVRVDWTGRGGPTMVRAVASLAAGGVPLVGGPVPVWAAGLGEELSELISSMGEEHLADALRREEHSVRLRRAALRAHGVRARWRALAAEAGLAVPPEPRVSVVLCTRRPGMVGFALAQIARQRHVRLEVVLALHGFPASLPEVASAVAEFGETGIPLVVHEADGGTVFGAVLNEAVDRVSGTLVAKWDDDDWYGPEHLADLLLARTYSGAEVVGAGHSYTYLQEIDLTVWRPARSEAISPAIAGGTILTDRGVLEETGGFRPRPRAVDSQFLLAAVRSGGCVYRTHGLGYVLRRSGEGHTWDTDLGYFLRHHTEQWTGWRPSALLEGAPAPLGDRPDQYTEHTGGHR